MISHHQTPPRCIEKFDLGKCLLKIDSYYLKEDGAQAQHKKTSLANWIGFSIGNGVRDMMKCEKCNCDTHVIYVTRCDGRVCDKCRVDLTKCRCKDPLEAQPKKA